jgi:hypothetical protein
MSGIGCTSQADAGEGGESCVNMATNTTAIANLNAQLTTWKKDLNSLQVYPIVSFGVAYAFRIR